ncbi:MAG: phasin family protein [Betaproteobacteria bacterium]
MIAVDGKISALNKKHVETAHPAAQIVFDSIEKLGLLNMEAPKLLFREGIAGAQTLSSVTVMEQLGAWRHPRRGPEPTGCGVLAQRSRDRLEGASRFWRISGTEFAYVKASKYGNGLRWCWDPPRFSAKRKP